MKMIEFKQFEKKKHIFILFNLTLKKKICTFYYFFYSKKVVQIPIKMHILMNNDIFLH